MGISAMKGSSMQYPIICINSICKNKALIELRDDRVMFARRPMRHDTIVITTVAVRAI